MKTVVEEIKRWIEDASSNTGIHISVVPDAEAQKVISVIVTRYVSGLPSWWWAQLKVPCEQFDRRNVKLAQILPSLEEEIYLIPEYPNHEGPVFLVNARDVEALLNDCPLFEYTILSKQADWLVAESHHDILYVCRFRGQHDD